MLKKLFLIVAFVIASASAYAQDQDMEWCGDAPEKYLANTTQIIISSDSPCNQNGEAFKDFIPQFRANKAFRDSRVKFDEEDNIGKFSFEALADWNDGKGYQLFKAVQKKLKCDKSYGTWYNVSADEVCFKYEDVLPCSEWGGSSMMARFQRIDGKWYLTGLMCAG